MKTFGSRQFFTFFLTFLLWVHSEFQVKAMDETAKSGVRTRKRNKSIKESAKQVNNQKNIVKL